MEGLVQPLTTYLYSESAKRVLPSHQKRFLLCYWCPQGVSQAFLLEDYPHYNYYRYPPLLSP